jgi:uncharacterized protein (TIGR02996 family)
VDSPGDETARLVYADWLDDRDEPRGAYLRAEVAWGKKRTSAAKKKLEKLAGGLDAVWVARVSRPPVGVCCDRIRFADCGPRLSAKKIDAAERELGCTFPPAYTAFLLNYNAGAVEPRDAAPTEDVTASCKVARSFYALGGSFDPESGTGPGDVVKMAEFLRGEEMQSAVDPEFPIDRLIPLATPEWDFDIVFLGVAGKEFGKVYHLSNLQDHGLDSDHLTVAAPSLPAFLAKLKPRWDEE